MYAVTRKRHHIYVFSNTNYMSVIIFNHVVIISEILRYERRLL